MSSDSDDSFSSDSDDEFLTIGNDGEGKVDREALVRKKLIESFYGKAAVQQASSTASAQRTGSTKHQHNKPYHDHHRDVEQQQQKKSANQNLTKRAPSVASRSLDNDDDDSQQAMEELSSGGLHHRAGMAPSKDLDSPYFDAEAFTQEHVMHSSIHTLLETEEKLALQVRTLDSTMQTLVYENYSRFIHATDAIKSISLGVSRNEQGLERLLQGIHHIDERSHSVEGALGRLRDEVAEKLRVKRLLTRLDALLKLPTTLHDQIAAGKYRLATQSFLSASSILRKHSTGFESLKTIETECRGILKNMVQQLQMKLRHWSGRKHMDVDDDEEDGDDHYNENGEENTSTIRFTNTTLLLSAPHAVVEPPKGISDIFECAGTLVMLLANQQHSKGIKEMDIFLDEADICRDDCLSMALAAALRLLERRLDTHQIELQEAEFASNHMNTTNSTSGLDMTMMLLDSKTGMDLNMNSKHSAEHVPKGRKLIPTNFLDGVLEAATLYGLSFGNGTVLQDPNERGLLVEFVSEVFASFLVHVRSVLVEQSLGLQLEEVPSAKKEEGDVLVDDDGDEAYEEISNAMTLLLHSVRELASGLALPEVGISVDFASHLIDQTVELTEGIVRRRIDQKFYNLRVRVVQECLRDFVWDAFAQPEEGESALSSLKSSGGELDRMRIVQLSSVALSDCLQLVDDTVRSVLSGGAVLGATASSVDRAMLKAAVQKSTQRFALWLAATLEVVAGCDSSDPEMSIAVKEDGTPATEDMGDRGGMASPRSVLQDDSQGGLDKTDPINQKLESAVQDLIYEVEVGSVTVYSDLILAMAEMCRLAERSVMENINQSISTHSGQGKKVKSSGLFPIGGASSRSKGLSDVDLATSERFRLAASRVLALYATNRGADAAAIVCTGFLKMARQEGFDVPEAPRAAAWQALEVAKLTASDCSAVLGGPKRAGPIPEFSEESVIPRNHPSLSTSLLGMGHQFAAIKGLQMDVERMFKEKVTIYPSPFKVLDFSRNSVLTIFFKVMFRAMLEQARLTSFTSLGYRQLLVDVEFLRHMVPHYLSGDYSDEGTNANTILSNLLNDVLSSAGERCYSLQAVEDESFYFTAQSIIQRFMHPSMSAEGKERMDFTQRFIIEE